MQILFKKLWGCYWRLFKVLEIDPKNSSALKNRGDANALDDYKGAIADYTEALLQLDQNTGFVIARGLQNGETEISRVLF